MALATVSQPSKYPRGSVGATETSAVFQPSGVVPSPPPSTHRGRALPRPWLFSTSPPESPMDWLTFIGTTEFARTASFARRGRHRETGKAVSSRITQTWNEPMASRELLWCLIFHSPLSLVSHVFFDKDMGARSRSRLGRGGSSTWEVEVEFVEHMRIRVFFVEPGSFIGLCSAWKKLRHFQLADVLA